MSGRVAVVTGGTGGIGVAVARSFAMAGAAVVIVGRSEPRLAAAERRLRDVAARERVLALALDVRREEEMAAMADAAVARWGRIDVLVTCAGVDARVRSVPDPVATLPDSSWHAVLDTNLRGTFLAVRAVMPAMFAQHRGDVLTVSSAPAGLRGQPLAAAYCASKFAVCALSEALAEEVRGKGVRVQTLVPGLVDTPLVQGSTLSRSLGSPLPPERVGEMARTLVTLPDDVTIPPVRRHGLPLLRHMHGPRGVGAAPRRAAPRARACSSGEPTRPGVAIVTGAGSGIGRATAQVLAHRGTAVVLVDRAAAAVEDVAAELTAVGARALPLVADTRDPDAMAAMADSALASFGRIDALVAAAGILRAPGSTMKPLADLPVAEWDAVIETNLTGAFLAVRAVLPAMVDRRSGHVITIASTSGRDGRALDSAYSASKAGLIGLTESLREEVAGVEIKVDVVVPDVVDTPLWQQNRPLPAPAGALAPERVGELIAMLLELPGDTAFADPPVAPFRGQRAPAPT